MEENGSNNICLAGIPRSGTTLACFLLNKVRDVVALDEPMAAGRLVDGRDPDVICDEVGAFFAQTRQSLLERRVAISRHVDGRVSDNHVQPVCREDGLREPIKSKGEVQFDKALSRGFLLIVKHPAAFSVLLPSLMKRWSCCAIVRNPLSVLGSWNSVDMRFRKGTGAFGSAMPEFDRELSGISDEVERQLRLLEFFYRQYRDVLRAGQVVRYEDIITSRGASLKLIAPEAAQLSEPLASKNKNPVYSADKLRTLGERLLESQGAYWDFYSRESVRELMSR